MAKVYAARSMSISITVTLADETDSEGPPVEEQLMDVADFVVPEVLKALEDVGSPVA